MQDEKTEHSRRGGSGAGTWRKDMLGLSERFERSQAEHPGRVSRSRVCGRSLV